jgi:transcriptional regulator with XRE-family HTH domain
LFLATFGVANFLFETMNTSTISERIQLLRKQKGFSQNELAELVGISKAQMSRYISKDVQPPADVLKKIADTLSVSVDFLLSGDTDQKAIENLTHIEVLQQYKEVDNLPDEERKTIIKVISALLRDYKTRQAYS